MLKKTFLAIALAAALGAQAQNAPLPAAPSTNTAASASKKDLVARILRAQQGSIEGMAQQLAERPAVEIVGNAMQYIGARVPKDKQEAMAKQVQAEAQKYAAAAVPIVTKRAVELAPTTVGTMLEQKFSDDELAQIASLLENPAILKYQRMLPEMQQALAQSLIADTRPLVEPKVASLEETVAKQLGIQNNGAAAQPGAKPPAKKKSQ